MIIQITHVFNHITDCHNFKINNINSRLIVAVFKYGYKT